MSTFTSLWRALVCASGQPPLPFRTHGKPPTDSGYGFPFIQIEDQTMSSICDFCSDPDVRWRYPTRSFWAYIVGSVAGESVGDWAACERCHDLIERGNPDSLAAKSVERLIGVHPEVREVREDLFREVTRLHRSFFACRSGRPQSTSTEPQSDNGDNCGMSSRND